MQSLHSFLGTHTSPYGVRLSMEDFAEYENIHVYPVYAVSRLVRGWDRRVLSNHFYVRGKKLDS